MSFEVLPTSCLYSFENYFFEFVDVYGEYGSSLQCTSCLGEEFFHYLTTSNSNLLVILGTCIDVYFEVRETKMAIEWYVYSEHLYSWYLHQVKGCNGLREFPKIWPQKSPQKTKFDCFAMVFDTLCDSLTYCFPLYTFRPVRVDQKVRWKVLIDRFDRL